MNAFRSDLDTDGMNLTFRPIRLPLLCFILVELLLPTMARAEQARFAIAANFIGPAKELIADFMQKTGDVVIPSFGSSGQFVIQIEQGADYAGFLSADEAKPAKLLKDGFGVDKSQFTYAIGKLVLWSNTPAYPASESTLRAARFNHLALCKPDVAPYGAAAMATLKQLRLEQTLQPRIVMGMDIAQAYQFVQSGNAELGFVALSQLHNTSAGTVWVVPSNLYPPIRQNALLLQQGAQNHVARAFLSYLQSKRAQAIIATYGYDMP
ncbi:molybdate ABC transporter substrate-binding protein [Acetobacter sp. LMG 32666]|uniref:molybdate ABC transporter substrate-binding protein n=1 Tax=Acetobacter sp. LMG 32666 TaxID=2959295 RepID=UPI0030C8ABEF